ncbi:hypothetical protein VaNZ11_011345 [Volvox africanus]|uniref:DNA repair protein RecN n=1 Tax=Volvox africanus TaxID=51714 RepID=A0ABQ5SB61_9CHLO|nr:hypothetical protein VaNZ11_011345 [Volvox africanus]
MALTTAGSHANTSAPGCTCSHMQRRTALSTRTPPVLLLRQLPCPLSHPHPLHPGSTAASLVPRAPTHTQALESHHHSHPLSRRCLWRLTARRTTNIARHLPWTQSCGLLASAPGATAPGSAHHANSRLIPPAVPGGPTGRSKPNSMASQGAASAASHHHFNPRYNHHHHNSNHQQHQPSSHSHAIQHQHQGGTLSGRGGAWGMPGPLAPLAGGPNPRYDSSATSSAIAAPQSSRHHPVPVPAPAPQPKSSPGESLLTVGTDGAASASTSASTSVLHPATSLLPSSTTATVTAVALSAARHGQPMQGPLSSSGPSSVPHNIPPGLPSHGSQTPISSVSPQLDSRSQAGGELTQLERLFIKDFALVSEQTVRLGPGLNVITGESGSGKSVLVEAFSQILGAPAPQECVRAAADTAVIEGTFLVGDEQREAVGKLLSSCGLPLRAMQPRPQPLANGAEDSAAGTPSSSSSINAGAGSGALSGPGALRLTVRREISQAAAGGHRSRVFLNGSPTSLRILREVGALLVDTNGQHSSMSLRDASTQLDLLDRIAGTSMLAGNYGAALARLREIEGRLDELDELDDEQERAIMQKLVDAVARLRVQPGEERELRRMQKKMEARRVAVEQCGLVRMALCGEGGAGGVTDALRTIEAQLNAILAQEEQNRAVAAAAAVVKVPRGKDGSKVAAAAADDDVAAAGAGEDDAGEEEADGDDDDYGDNGAAAGARLMEEALEQVAAAKDILAEAETTVKAYARRYQFSQADHDAVAERLARIERLMKQASAAGFGAIGGGGGIGSGTVSRGGFRGAGGGSRISSTEQLLELARECSAKLAAYYEMEGQRAEWEAQLEALVSELRNTALQLSSRRRAAAAALRSAVEGCLRDLAMGGSRFDVRIGWAEDRTATEGLYVGEEEAEEAGVAELGGRTYVLGARGLDQVEFLLAAGPAEPLRPLAAVVSGGESARIMLALKAAPAQAGVAAAAAAAGCGGGAGGVPIMILDELDSGIGARLGSAVGSILARMALPTHGSNSQIICVTHLPQVACYATHHIKVQKQLPQLPNDDTSGATGSSSSSPYARAIPVENLEALTAPLTTSSGPAAAARVTTSFVPLRTFEQRAEEVAAMLGLDRGVAEEMLCNAQSQVAAMYPPGSLPEGLLFPGQNTHAHAPVHMRNCKRQEEKDWSRRGGDTVPETTAPGQWLPADGGDDSLANVRRVVQETLRSGDVAEIVGGGGGSGSRISSGFSVVVSPAMDPNAVRLGGGGGGEAALSGAAAAGGRLGVDGHSSASGGSGDGKSVVQDDGDDYDDQEAAEAELSAQLLAGVEAAAMQHLKRMEAQAKEAAAAASAAAAIMAPIESSSSSSSTAPLTRAVPPGSAAAGAAVVVTAANTSGEAPVVSELRRQTSAPPHVGDVTSGPRGEEQRVANEEDEEAGEQVGSDGPGAGAGAPDPQPKSEIATACVGDAKDRRLLGGESEPSLSVGSGNADAITSATAVNAAAVNIAAVRTSAEAGSSAAAGNGNTIVSYSPSTGLSYDVATVARDSRSEGSTEFNVTVQPSKSPLPYNFSVGADRDATEPSTEAESVRDVVDNRYGHTHLGNPYDNVYGREDAQEDQEWPWYQEFGANDGTAESPSQVYDTADPSQYTYGVGDAVAGGRFVVVPSGSENEFNEMFRTIMSFSREDYEQEAMRSHEVTLAEALRDAGMGRTGRKSLSYGFCGFFYFRTDGQTDRQATR